MSRESDYYKCIKMRSVVCREKATTEIAFACFQHREKATTIKIPIVHLNVARRRLLK